jgi:hypothetical protein
MHNLARNGNGNGRPKAVSPKRDKSMTLMQPGRNSLDPRKVIPLNDDEINDF